MHLKVMACCPARLVGQQRLHASSEIFEIEIDVAYAVLTIQQVEIHQRVAQNHQAAVGVAA